MRSSHLLAACEQFSDVCITVIGDLMLDTYVWGEATRISPEAPVMVVEVQRDSTVPGGAANVVNNLLALGAEVNVIGICGDDEAGDRLISELKSRGANTDGIIRVTGRPTTVKTRVVTQGQQIVRIDREVTEPINGQIELKLMDSIQRAGQNSEATLISDYAKGLITGPIASAALAPGRITTVNAKPKNANLYRGADLVMVNQVEAEAMTGEGFRSDHDFMDHGSDLREKLGVKTLIVTRGGKGMVAFSEGQSPIVVPARGAEVYDVAGAGDTVVSTLTIALATGSDLTTASHLAMRAAAIVVGKLGVATVSTNELREALLHDEH